MLIEEFAGRILAMAEIGGHLTDFGNAISKYYE